jgi:hypothetical protein
MFPLTLSLPPDSGGEGGVGKSGVKMEFTAGEFLRIMFPSVSAIGGA